MTDISFQAHYGRNDLQPYVIERRLTGSTPSQMFELAQPPGNFSDPPLSELLVCVTLRSHHSRYRNGNARTAGRLDPGDLQVVAPGTPTEIQLLDNNGFLVLAIPGQRAAAVLGELGRRREPFDFGALHQHAPAKPLITSLLERMWNEACSATPLGGLYSDALEAVLLGELVLLAKQVVPPPVRGGLSPSQLRQVCDYLQAHLADDVSLADLAAMVGLSVSHLCRAFKQSTGLPPHQWRMARRIERARELLEHGLMPVTEIAALVGYGDPGQFAVTFRQQVGVSPTRYRRDRQS